MAADDDDDIPPAGDVDAPPAARARAAPDAEDAAPSRAAMVIGVAAIGLVGGAGAYVLLDGAADEDAPPVEARVPSPPPRPRSLAAALSGPCGEVKLPPARTTIVNVWLQGCADCMPAFAGWKALRDARRLPDAPVVNVAYGTADRAWADAHGVGDCLVFDRGGASVVRPLGISSFTTLVVDARGEVTSVGRPESDGYLARLGGAVAAAAR